tara:strand:+ start:41 stop:154 length:114 start_codon:yes stop_codon:yes gene_type:complete
MNLILDAKPVIHASACDEVISPSEPATGAQAPLLVAL